MLRISKLADYSTVIMVYLAKSKTLCNVSEIAKATHVNKPTVSKLVKQMVSANLLISERGTKGGYRLTKSPTQITVADIVYAVETRTGLTECSDIDNQCAIQTYCQVSDHWRVIDKAISDVLSAITLSTLLQPSPLKMQTEETCSE